VIRVSMGGRGGEKVAHCCRRRKSRKKGARNLSDFIK
jgi:hypothetical protein